MAPHAEHTDPSQHPQCIVCRTLLLLGERAPSGAASDPEAPTEPAPEPGRIAWIPIVGGSAEP